MEYGGKAGVPTVGSRLPPTLSGWSIAEYCDPGVVDMEGQSLEQFGKQLLYSLSQPVFIKHLLCVMHHADVKDVAANKPFSLLMFIVTLSVVGKCNLQIWSWEPSWRNREFLWEVTFTKADG